MVFKEWTWRTLAIDILMISDNIQPASTRILSQELSALKYQIPFPYRTPLPVNDDPRRSNQQLAWFTTSQLSPIDLPLDSLDFSIARFFQNIGFEVKFCNVTFIIVPDTVALK